MPRTFCFLERDEVLSHASHASSGTDRRRLWARNRKLSPPLAVGKMPKIVQKMRDDAIKKMRTTTERRECMPASAGRASGVARLNVDLADTGRPAAGEILVSSAATGTGPDCGLWRDDAGSWREQPGPHETDTSPSAGISRTLGTEALGMIIALLAAACGGSGPAIGPGSSTPSASSAFEQALAFARCVRAHGYPTFPDPPPAGAQARSVASPAGIDLNSPRFKAVLSSCNRQYFGSSDPPGATSAGNG